MSEGNEEKWARLREPFPSDMLELLPKPTERENPKGRCDRPDVNGFFCGGWHGLPAVHLTYVGHAGITMRLQEVDPEWSWEPIGHDADGLPLVKDGCLWIYLTVLGVRRIGVGDAVGSLPGPMATKVIVGDALRNAAMRFGIGAYLWSKSEHARSMASPEPEHTGEVVPAGYADWVLELRAASRHGNAALKAAHAQGSAELQEYLRSESQQATWTSIKADASAASAEKKAKAAKREPGQEG